MNNNQEIAERIKLCAKAKKIPIKNMLTDLGLGINLISHLAKGQNITASNLARIADYLGCSVDYLLGRSEEKEKPTAPEGDELDELLKDPELHQNYDLIADLDDEDLDDLLSYCEFLASRASRRAEKDGQ